MGWRRGDPFEGSRLTTRLPGTTIRLGDRLYMSSGPTSDVAEFGVSPVLAPVLGASVSAGDTVLAMPDGDIELPFSRDFYGPWTINWVEWLA